jgi:hypothetical protein
MSKNTVLANATANAQASTLAALLNSGYLRLYSGTQPASADTALSGNTLLAELRFGATAFGAPTNGVIVANAITADSDAKATGTAAFFRAFSSDGVTVVMDGSVDTANANMVLATTSISQHQTVSCSSFTHTVAKSTAGL